jgi:hypothetical protein
MIKSGTLYCAVGNNGVEAISYEELCAHNRTRINVDKFGGEKITACWCNGCGDLLAYKIVDTKQNV